jgi:cell division protein FtsW
MVNPLRYLYRKFAQQQTQGYDLVLLSAAVLLTLTGLVMIYSASSNVSDRNFGTSLYYLRAHLAHLTIGIAALAIAMRVPVEFWRRCVPFAMLGCFLMLILVLIPGIGHQVGGARRWFRLGFISIQPTELLKIVLIAFVASYLDRKRELVAEFFRGVAPGLTVMGVFLLLVVMQPDFGNMVLITLTLLMMIFVGGAKPGHILGSLAGFSVIGVYLVASQSYRMKRFLAFLNPWDDRLDSGFQIIQSYLAFGSGGMAGVGLGASRQKMFFLPDAHTDFIFSILGEELGLIGVLAVMALFAVLLWRGYRISLNATEDFDRYMAYGITSLVGMQVLLNLAVVMGMIPTKGLPLPFISAGGSSVVMTLFMTGILLRIGRRPHSWSTERPARGV